ncbi:MAG TPA: Eco57I restriction-modification methylase domain-containing protein [Mycobacteriales bacterium]|nr:Eco57I restriction-modification methylase domain-containing protein [Mycobacteriales bacterium]
MSYFERQMGFEAMSIATLRVDQSEVPPADHGEVFTRRWVVDLVLDLAGYTAERDLASLTAVEPGCGQGAFLIPMVARLVASCAARGRDLRDAGHAIQAYDLLASNVEASQRAVAQVLTGHGAPCEVAQELAQGWVSHADFLLRDEESRTADFVLGNPPYIRLENVPTARSAAYRDVCRTMRGRSDVFVGFIERGLALLGDGGVLGFIVADRWMRNQYGAELREMISDGYSVDSLIQMHDVDAFEDRVSAYPAISIIRRGPQGRAVLAEATAAFGHRDAATLTRWVKSERGTSMRGSGVQAARLPGWYEGSASWPTGSPEELRLVADLESRFPPLEDRRTRTRVGIGVASGSDAVYLTDDPDVVESDRLLPLVMSGDTVRGTVSWSGTYLVNPWRDGQLVELADYPKLQSYLTDHGAAIRSRHVAQRNPMSWYRTIDRVEPGLREQPKLLLPDLKASIHPVLEPGHLYPHHNLYFVTSGAWDLEVLGGLLLCDVANLFVGVYCVKMRGGCYRFQAQYLRRIRVPSPESLGLRDKRALADAFLERDVEAATDIARRLYGIDELPASCRTMVSRIA